MQKTLLFLLIGVLIVGGIVLAVSVATSGLPSRTRTLAETETRNFDTARAELKRTTAEVAKALTDEAAFFKSYAPSAEWPAALKKLEADLAAAWKHRDEVDTLLAKDDRDDRGKIEELLDTLRAARLAASAGSAEIGQTCRKLLEFKKQSKQKAEQVAADYQAVGALKTDGLKAKIDKAVVDWPNKKADLERRLAAVEAERKRAAKIKTDSQPILDLAAKGTLPGDKVVVLFQASRDMAAIRASVTAAARQLPSLIEQLNWSWEKVLADMEIREGHLVTFHHKIQTIRTPALAKEGDKVTPKESSSWGQVTKARYEAMKNHLGMVVEEKPAGKYDHEAKRVTQPPGYAYIASRSRERNHYGYWHHGPTGSYWHWHRPYSYMGGYYWGRAYRPISAGDYGQYAAARSSGRTYTGGGRYGSSGAATKSKYAASKYVRTGGFRSTQYVKSGGSYRGSKYVRKPSSSYRSSRYSSGSSRSSYRSSSSRSSGSRSGGGK